MSGGVRQYKDREATPTPRQRNAANVPTRIAKLATDVSGAVKTKLVRMFESDAAQVERLAGEFVESEGREQQILEAKSRNIVHQIEKITAELTAIVREEHRRYFGQAKQQITREQLKTLRAALQRSNISYLTKTRQVNQLLLQKREVEQALLRTQNLTSVVIRQYDKKKTADNYKSTTKPLLEKLSTTRTETEKTLEEREKVITEGVRSFHEELERSTADLADDDEIIREQLDGFESAYASSEDMTDIEQEIFREGILGGRSSSGDIQQKDSFDDMEVRELSRRLPDVPNSNISANTMKRVPSDITRPDSWTPTLNSSSSSGSSSSTIQKIDEFGGF